ncbi:hypothetical protein DFH09DRAFT_1275385 [Mycena vulgaris]|nr:hypothetical protein DFH09DRAFT_1275385 [Mycena vulgaris]
MQSSVDGLVQDIQSDEGLRGSWRWVTHRIFGTNGHKGTSGKIRSIDRTRIIYEASMRRRAVYPFSLATPNHLPIHPESRPWSTSTTSGGLHERALSDYAVPRPPPAMLIREQAGEVRRCLLAVTSIAKSSSRRVVGEDSWSSGSGRLYIAPVTASRGRRDIIERNLQESGRGTTRSCPPGACGVFVEVGGGHEGTAAQLRWRDVDPEHVVPRDTASSCVNLSVVERRGVGRNEGFPSDTLAQWAKWLLRSISRPRGEVIGARSYGFLAAMKPAENETIG